MINIALSKLSDVIELYQSQIDRKVDYTKSKLKVIESKSKVATKVIENALTNANKEISNHSLQTAQKELNLM